MYSKKEASEIIEKGSDDTKFVVRTSAEDEEFNQNRENILLGRKIGEIHSQYDEDIISTTGIEKEAGEKTYNYNKRVLKFLKEKAEASGDDKLKQEVEDLKKQLEAKPDDLSKQEIEGLRKALKVAQDEAKTTLATKDSELSQMEIRHAIDSARTGLKFRSDIPEAAINALMDSVMNKLLESGKKNEQGDIVFFKGDEILLDTKTGKPRDASVILTEELDSVLDKGKKQDGTGGKGSTKGADGKPVLPSDVDGLDGLTTWISSLGHASGSEEHQALYDQYRDQVVK